MIDRDDHHPSGNIPLPLVQKIDGGQGHPHLEDNFDLRDSQTASSNSVGAQRDEQQFCDGQHPKIPDEELLEILQSVHIPRSTVSAIAALRAAINQTNALILQ